MNFVKLEAFAKSFQQNFKQTDNTNNKQRVFVKLFQQNFSYLRKIRPANYKYYTVLILIHFYYSIASAYKITKKEKKDRTYADTLQYITYVSIQQPWPE